MRSARRWSTLLAFATGLATACDEDPTVTRPPSVCDVELGLADAIEAAGDAVPGIVIEGEIEIEYGEALYDIDVVTDDRVTEVAVDPESGAVEVDEDEPEPEDFEAADVLAVSPTSLVDAIDTAEAQADGCAVLVEVELAVEPADSLIKVVVQTDDEAVAVKIRTEDGMVMDVGVPDPDDD